MRWKDYPVLQALHDTHINHPTGSGHFWLDPAFKFQYRPGFSSALAIDTPPSESSDVVVVPRSIISIPILKVKSWRRHDMVESQVDVLVLDDSSNMWKLSSRQWHQDPEPENKDGRFTRRLLNYCSVGLFQRKMGLLCIGKNPETEGN